MGEKKNENKKGGDGENKEKGSSAIVFKVDCLCDGCAIKVLKCIREVQGVEKVTIESGSNKVTVTGAVDPTAIKEKLVKKTKKKVDLISPQPKKDENKEEKKAEKEKNQDSGNDNGKKPEKKPKEAPVTTADLKVQPYCQCWGCTVKIRKIVADTKGVHELKVDKVKELVTVKGTMDVKSLAETLKDKLKKNVEIVPLKKEKEKEKEKEKGGKKEGGEGGDGGKGKKKNKEGGNGGAGDGVNQAATTGGGGGNGKMEGARMEFMVQPQFGYMPGYPGYGYGHQHGQGYPGYPVSVHPPHHLFNDENPNACSTM
ncbi:heavy metal-associated isoprenylated plant protein 3-like [Hibiscus syriacus]|uniref:heavy metal-associated isoprenylated plant protein 3-like n=1 Tax=Hibiscus syriacus TaxID=106335 RepID=UPI0019234861|nr:heavy metal-associated isoprenylated plant protein 3-like [Hibiscus syriacus]